MERILAKALIILILVSGIVYGEESEDNMISLSSLISETSASLRWDPYRSVGELTLMGKSLIFKPGIPFLLFDHSGKSEDLIVERGENGDIFFSSAASNLIVDFFTLSSAEKNYLRIKAIIIDPGHGGKDPGALGRYFEDGKQHDLQEKNIVLTVGQEVAESLRRTYADKDIILTRSADEFVTLEQRTVIANEIELKKNESIIFISIHANASLNSKANGFEVWYLPPDYRRELLDESVIESENQDVLPILNTMLEEEITVESILLAQSIQSSLRTIIGDKIADRGLKEESWFVVRNAKMPAVLVELGFITNQEEALILGNQTHLKKISEGIYNGISGFINHFENQYSSGE
jgi:N-acetylmuramoyl-L-alanine amidase